MDTQSILAKAKAEVSEAKDLRALDIVSAYLEVTDLPAESVKYLPVNR